MQRWPVPAIAAKNRSLVLRFFYGRSSVVQGAFSKGEVRYFISQVMSVKQEVALTAALRST